MKTYAWVNFVLYNLIPATKTWATSWENLSYAICQQQRRTSTYAHQPAQSDQHLCCSLPRKYNSYICYIHNLKNPASYLVAEQAGFTLIYQSFVTGSKELWWRFWLFSMQKPGYYARHCRDISMVKDLAAKSPAQIPAGEMWNYSGRCGHGIKSPAVPRHCGHDTELKAWHLNPAMSLLSPAPQGPWLQMTGALPVLKPLMTGFLGLCLAGLILHPQISNFCFIWTSKKCKNISLLPLTFRMKCLCPWAQTIILHNISN